MNKRRFSKSEKSLFKILMILIFLLLLNVFIIKPINSEITQLKMDKENIIRRKEIDENIISINSEKEEDAILKIEKELSKIINIDYIDKKMTYDENNEDVINLQIKVSGTLDNIFSMQETLNRLNLMENIEYIEINNIKKQSETDVENQELIECIMEINVG